MAAMWRGTWHGGLEFTEKCCAPIAIPIATHTPARRRAAMAAQRLGEDSVTVAFLGDGATSEGDTHEAMNLAAVTKAPCVFYVQNNQWAISVPVHRQHAASIAARAAGWRDARHHRRRQRRPGLLCRHGGGGRPRPRRRGPTLIEAITYRMGPHTTSDDPSRYRSAEEVEEWAARDDQPLPDPPGTPGCGPNALSSAPPPVSARLPPKLRTAVIDGPTRAGSCSTTYAEITPTLAAQKRQLLTELAGEA